MKIFDWVHRRIHTNMEYCRVPRHKKDGTSLFACADHPYAGEGDREDHGCEKKKAETEKEALLMDLHHVASIQQVLDGILTIGTLGHLEYHCQKELLDVGPHANPEYQSVTLASKEEEPVAEEEKEEEEPPVEAAASAAHPNHNMIIESFKKEMLEILDTNINGSGSDHQNAAGEEGDLLEPLLQAMNANRRERVTLADLFMASEDAPAANNTDPTSLKVAPAPAGRVAPQKEAKGTVGTNGKPAPPPGPAKRGGSSLAKKLAPWKKEGEDSPPPAKKLQRVMRRMLKKKIHPEMPRDVNPSASSMQACRCSGEGASLIWCIPLTTPLQTLLLTALQFSHHMPHMINPPRTS